MADTVLRWSPDRRARSALDIGWWRRRKLSAIRRLICRAVSLVATWKFVRSILRTSATTPQLLSARTIGLVPVAVKRTAGLARENARILSATSATGRGADDHVRRANERRSQRTKDQKWTTPPPEAPQDFCFLSPQ